MQSVKLASLSSIIDSVVISTSTLALNVIGHHWSQNWSVPRWFCLALLWPHYCSELWKSASLQRQRKTNQWHLKNSYTAIVRPDEWIIIFYYGIILVCLSACEIELHLSNALIMHAVIKRRQSSLPIDMTRYCHVSCREDLQTSVPGVSRCEM